MKNFFKKNYKYLITFICTFLLIFICEFTYCNFDNDNIWNFHMIQKVFLGYIPYKEINILITPLFHYLGSFLMHIMGDNFITFYVYGALILASIATLILRILDKITEHNSLKILGISLVLLAFQGIYFTNYNTLILIFPIILILMEWRREKFISNNKQKKYDFIIGIILALCFLTKQTVGGVFSLVYVIYLLIYDKLKFQKINWKSIVRKIIGAMFVIIPFLLYLLITDSFIQFIDLCFGGIFDFGQKNSAGAVFTWHTILILAVSIFCFMWFKLKEKDTKMLLLGMLSFSSLVICFPLANEYHLVTATLISIITLVYILAVIINNIENKKYMLQLSRGFGYIFIISILLKVVTNVIEFDLSNPPSELKNYIGVNASQEVYEDIINVNKYIKTKEAEGYNVYIMSASASKYMIPMRKNNYKYDLILQGNLGYKGEEKLLEEIAEIDNPLFLKEEELIFQESVIVDEYIKTNYTLIDKIGKFNVYAEIK